ncbi:hypothetical protein ACWEQ8_39120 [Streptomyces noursei]
MLLDQAQLPATDDNFPRTAKITGTAISGGAGFSVTPDCVYLNVDVCRAAGPSDRGNLLAFHGAPATAG